MGTPVAARKSRVLGRHVDCHVGANGTVTAPQITAEASQIELDVRRGRVPRVAYIVIAVILGGIFLMTAFMVAFALLLVFLEG